ncbi:peptidase domain-containing ABC transporter [Acidithiobacillus sulfuriphilus]|uniref:peptidase domain-containing ABC transporter n=1 Tax=Acidithiobacillus sulfuriphilus TaxID=1867749 RepID=UPI003F63B990
MPSAVEPPPAAHTAIPSGIWALTRIAAFHQRPLDANQILRALGLERQAIGITEILLACAEIHLKAKESDLGWTDFGRLRLPIVVQLRNGDFGIAGRISKERIPLTRQGNSRPEWLDQEAWERIYSGHAILINERLSFANPNRPFGFGWFVPILWKFRKELGEILVAAFFFQLLGIGLPLFIQVIIDKVFVYDNRSTLIVVASGMLVIILFEGVFGILQSVLLSHGGNRIDVTLGSALYRHLVRIPLRYFEQRRVGDTTARVREVERIRSFLTGQALLSVVDGLFVFVYIGILLFYSADLTLVVVAAMLLIALTTAVFRPALRMRLEERFNAGADSQAFLVESVTGMETVKAMSLEASMVQRWERLLARYVSAAYRADRLGGISNGISRTLRNLATLAILWFGARLVLEGTLSVGALIAFQMLSSRAIAPMLRVSSLWQQFQQVAIAVRRLGDLMDAPAEPVLLPDKASLPPLRGDIRFDRVSFRYHSDGPRVLEDVSFETRAGMTIGIVGRSGSGKSTLAKLIERLYVPEHGRILVDGYDMAQADPGWLRRQIAVVPQESFLFGGSIRENIAVRNPGASMEQIVTAARLSGAHEFVMDLPEGYETLVGERGASLSGGQRQRLAIARALLTNPRILILDEATSALDYESEHIIQDNLDRIRQGRTLIIVAHRLSMLRGADRILVLDRGRIVEMGSHDELLAKRGIYRHLYTQQGLAA